MPVLDLLAGIESYLFQELTVKWDSARVYQQESS